MNANTLTPGVAASVTRLEDRLVILHKGELYLAFIVD